MKFRNVAAWAAGIGVAWYTLANNSAAALEATWTAAGVVFSVGDAIASVINSVAPTAVAGIAAPFATAAASWYIANSALNFIWVDNRIAKGLGVGWAAVLWWWVWGLAQSWLLAAAAAKWTWDIAKMAWKSEALRKLWQTKPKQS